MSISSGTNDAINDHGVTQDDSATNANTQNDVKSWIDGEYHGNEIERTMDKNSPNNIIADALAEIVNNVSNGVHEKDDNTNDDSNNGEQDDGAGDDGTDVIAGIVGGIFDDINAQREEEDHFENQDSQPEEAHKLESLQNHKEEVHQSGNIVNESHADELEENASNVEEDHFDMNDAIAQMVTETVNEVSRVDEEKEKAEKEEDQSKIEANYEDKYQEAISRIVNETVNQISEEQSNQRRVSIPGKVDEVQEKDNGDTQEKHKDDDDDDDDDDDLSNAMNDAFAQLLKDTLNDSSQKNIVSEEKNPEMDSTELLISGAVNEIMKSVSEVNSEVDQETIKGRKRSFVQASTKTAEKDVSATDIAESTIARIVQNVQNAVQLIPMEEPEKVLLVNTQEDFQYAMDEMIRKVADEIIPDDEGEAVVQEDTNDLQFAIEEMVKNVVDETYEDSTPTDTYAARSSLIDSLLQNSDLTSSIVSSTLEKRGLELSKKKALDLAEELMMKRNAITSREYATTPNLRDLLNKRVSQANAASSLSFPASFYTGAYTATTAEKINEVAAKVSATSKTNLQQQKGWALKSLNNLLYGKQPAPAPAPAPTTPTLSTTITQAVNYVLQILMSNQKDMFKIDDKERVRLDNRTRKQKWREKNNSRNKDNDLRFRVHKRANVMFGEKDSEEKQKWITEEFNKRKSRRIERLKKTNNDNGIYTGPAVGKRNITNSMINESIINFVKDSLLNAENKETAAPLVGHENTQAISEAISNALNAANLNVSHELFTSTIMSLVTSYMSNNKKFDENILKTIQAKKPSESPATTSATNSKVKPPSKTPDPELTSLVKNGAVAAYYRNKNAKKNISIKSSTALPAIDPSIMDLDGDKKTLSNLFSNISLVPSKRKGSETPEAASTTKKPDLSFGKNKSNDSSKKPKAESESTIPKPSFRLPIYRRSISSAVSSTVVTSTSVKTTDMKPASPRSAPVAKKPSILSSLGMQTNRAIGGPKRGIGAGVFRRPLYRSATNT